MVQEHRTAFFVFIVLVFLTLVTAATAYVEVGRIMAVSTAFSIAAMKATFIALYFMHLRRESPLIYLTVFVGLFAILVFAIGVFPDVVLNLF